MGVVVEEAPATCKIPMSDYSGDMPGRRPKPESEWITRVLDAIQVRAPGYTSRGNRFSGGCRWIMDPTGLVRISLAGYPYGLTRVDDKRYREGESLMGGWLDEAKNNFGQNNLEHWISAGAMVLLIRNLKLVAIPCDHSISGNSMFSILRTSCASVVPVPCDPFPEITEIRQAMQSGGLDRGMLPSTCPRRFRIDPCARGFRRRYRRRKRRACRAAVSSHPSWHEGTDSFLSPWRSSTARCARHRR